MDIVNNELRDEEEVSELMVDWMLGMICLGIVVRGRSIARVMMEGVNVGVKVKVGTRIKKEVSLAVRWLLGGSKVPLLLDEEVEGVADCLDRVDGGHVSHGRGMYNAGASSRNVHHSHHNATNSTPISRPNSLKVGIAATPTKAGHV